MNDVEGFCAFDAEILFVMTHSNNIWPPRKQ